MLNVEDRDTIHARVLEHNKSLIQSLERPVGVVVALHDLLANIDRQISRPKIIELDIYRKIAKSAVTEGFRQSCSNRRGR
jgi:pyridoxine 5'-phosphate synthase PdxJ